MPRAFPCLPFGLAAENEVISHRGLFSPDFKLQRGCIYHLGSPAEEDEAPFWFTGGLLDWETENFCLKFLPEYAPVVQGLLAALMADSPAHQLDLFHKWHLSFRGSLGDRGISGSFGLIPKLKRTCN